MKFSKKTLILASCMILCITMTAFGTIAYLTDRESVVNTFTVGNIDIVLDETQINEDGERQYWVDTNGNGTPEPGEFFSESEPESANGVLSRVIENKYKLIPGKSYIKDPQMTVVKGSEECFVNKVGALTRILNTTKEQLPYVLLGGWDETEANEWIASSKNPIITDTTNDLCVYEFRHKGPVDATNGDVVLPPLFTELIIPAGLHKTFIENEGLEALEIVVDGHAIQTAAFEDKDGKTAEQIAWESFDIQMPLEDEYNKSIGDEGNGDDDNTTENP